MSSVIESVKRFSDAARDYLNYDECYLFGSYAKGKATTSSDIDVAVITSTDRIDKSCYMDLIKDLSIKAAEINDLIELHLLFTDDNPCGFLEHVKKTGIRIA